ncbi:DUF6624 domain-containing protein [Saccharopolyspora taberi]|uniref:Uncharacterized protein n=1 Tax=Saccharopolyspora taberi TaxID=60895 RepID=A0ABN3VEZ9_9PSEU
MEHEFRAELLRRSALDQQAREHWLGGGGGWAEVKRIDADNTAWLTGIVAEHGWPGQALVGVDGAHAAWLLAQHAPPEHQVRWLDLLREAVARGDAQARDLAYLEDRVHIHQGTPQRYGTQWFGIGDNATRLFPLADAGRVNARRAAVDLPPIDEHDLDNAWQLDELRQLLPAHWGDQ